MRKHICVLLLVLQTDMDIIKTRIVQCADHLTHTLETQRYNVCTHMAYISHMLCECIRLGICAAACV
jgi:hypothetical protein